MNKLSRIISEKIPVPQYAVKAFLAVMVGMLLYLVGVVIYGINENVFFSEG